MSKDFNTENYITLGVTEDLEGEILQDGETGEMRHVIYSVCHGVEPETGLEIDFEPLKVYESGTYKQFLLAQKHLRMDLERIKRERQEAKNEYKINNTVH